MQYTIHAQVNGHFVDTHCLIACNTTSGLCNTLIIGRYSFHLLLNFHVIFLNPTRRIHQLVSNASQLSPLEKAVIKYQTLSYSWSTSIKWSLGNMLEILPIRLTNSLEKSCAYNRNILEIVRCVTELIWDIILFHACYLRCQDISIAISQGALFHLGNTIHFVNFSYTFNHICDLNVV